MYTYAAKLVRVIDADTVVLDVDLGFKLWRTTDSYRLSRIDAPEINTEAGLAAKRALSDYLIGKGLMVTTAKADNFGRWLIELYAQTVNVNDWLVSNSYAVYRTY